MLLGPGEIRMKRRFSLQKYAHSRANHEIEAGGDNEEETCRMHNVWFLEETVCKVFVVTPQTIFRFHKFSVSHR